MTRKSSLAFIALGVGVAAGIGGIFANSFEPERSQQHDDEMNDPALVPVEQSDAALELSGAEEQADPSLSNKNGTQPESMDSAGSQMESVVLDDKTIGIMDKINLEMDLVIDKLSETERALERGDLDLSQGYIEDARVQMSKVIGQQRQLLIVLEGGNGQPHLGGDTNQNQTDSQGSDDSPLRTSQVHLTILENIIDALVGISNMITESRQIWSQKEYLDKETAHEQIVELAEKYHDKVRAPVQIDLSILANLTEIKQDALISAINADAVTTLVKIKSLYEADLKSLESYVEDDNKSYSQSMYTSVEDLKRLKELRDYALDKINEDRKSFGQPPVRLGHNKASQIHAEDVFRTGKLSHWMTNGEKPYMTYSRLGGNDSVFQNVAIGGYSSYQICLSDPGNDCTRFSPYEIIDILEYEMIYNDVQCCDDGHKYNIVDPRHNLVSIGIAYNDYFLVIVQNFENDYVDLDYPLAGDVQDDTLRGTLVNMTGDVSHGYRVFGITINYDELPTRSVYDLNKNKNYYDAGEVIAAVQQKNAYIEYEKEFLVGDSYSVIEAMKWSEENHARFNIEFDLSDLKNDSGGSATKDGVYTISLWVQDQWEMGVFEAITYSVFVQ